MHLTAIGATKLPISTITRRLVIVHAVIMIVALAVLGPNAFMSWQGVATTIVLDLVVYATLRKPNERTVVVLLCSAWFAILFMLPRLTAFLVFPANTIGFVAVDPIKPDEIVAGLGYVIAGYLALWAGCELGGLIVKPTDRAFKPRTLPLWGIGAFMVVALAAAAYVSYGLGVSVYSTDETQWGSRIGWITRVFDMDAGLVLLLTWMAMNPKRTATENIVAYALVAAWLLFILSVGSRGGPLRIMLFTGVAAFAVYGDVRITLRKVLAVLLVTVVASGMMYAPASIFRLQASSGDAAAFNFVEAWSREGPVRDDQGAIWPTRAAWVTSPIVQKVAGFVSPVITRLGLLDYPLIVVNRQANEAMVDKYLRSTHALENFANNMIPGEAFPGSDVMTSRVFTLVFRGYDEQHIRTSFLSEPWTLWGYSWLVGGGVFGGLAIIAGLSAVVQAAYHLTGKLGLSFAPYATTAFLVMGVVSGLLQLFGLDHWLTIMAHFSIAVSAGFLLAWLIARLFWAMRERRMSHG